MAGARHAGTGDAILAIRLLREKMARFGGMPPSPGLRTNNQPWGMLSLIEHCASVEGPNERTLRNFLHTSGGLQNTEAAIGDLEHALK